MRFLRVFLWYAFTPTACAASEAEAVAAAEEDAEVLEKRGDLFVLFRNLAKVAPNAAYSFVTTRLQTVLTRPSASFQVGASGPLRGLYYHLMQQTI